LEGGQGGASVPLRYCCRGSSSLGEMQLAEVVAEVVEEREGVRACMLWRDLQPLHSTLEVEEMEEERNGGKRN
jgi:hypothetical protein